MTPQDPRTEEPVRIAIIDYGMGNLRSVMNAFASLGADARVAEVPADLASADRIVLPGVGAFGDGMENLRRLGWIPALEREVREGGKPFLGICLGMQLLATEGTEFGAHKGLGWIPGAADRIQPSDPSLRVPHIGWNDVRFVRRNGLFAGLGETDTFYFVHSYALMPEDGGIVSGVCDYGGEFAAGIESGNLYATQFHPEKSQKAGMSVLRNFLAVTAR